MKKMHVSANNGIETAENSFFQQLFFRYWPYWPLFIILMICGLGAGYAYLRLSTPLFESSATILIKDEKKGLDDSKTIESLNPLSSKKIVENETEIIRSRAILGEVVKELHLYAPVFEKDGLVIKSAYTTSPVTIELKYPDSLTEVAHVIFTWSAADKSITIDKNKYPVNTWVNAPWGITRFMENPLYHQAPVPPEFYFSFIDAKNVAKYLSDILEVTPVSKLSTVINLKITDASPARGEAILNSIIYVYNKVSITDKTQLATNTLNFVEKRLKLIEGELDSTEGRIQKYRTEKGAVDLTEQSQWYLKSVGESDQKASQLNVQLAALDEVEKYVVSKTNQAGVVPASFGIQDPLLSDLIGKLYESEIQYERLRKTTGENNAVLVSLQNEINKIKPNIIEIIRNQRKSLEAGRDNINGSISKYSSLLKSVPKQEQELAEMKRPVGIKNNIYTFLLQKREEAALSYGATVSDSRLVDKAESSIRPVSPKRSGVILVSLLGAIALGIVLVMLKEGFNSKILFRSDIESYTTLPILGEVIYDNSKKPLLVSGHGRSFVEEQFRQIRTSLNYLSNPATTKKIMITSSVAGEGKSFIAANLALSLAATDRKVVLVDMDLYMPQIANIFDIPNDLGVSDYLTSNIDADDIIKKTEASENLFIVPAGNNSDGNLSELVLNGKAQQLLSYLETIFDTIIIDTTPVLAITDAYTISSWCDATVYVIRHAFTPKIHVQRLDDNAELHRLKNTGIVFNGIRKRGVGKYGFGYGYGYDYDYGYKYRQQKQKKTSKTSKRNVKV
ncbi:MAG TPA: polysaccharide biosynthesis tyrosine autokinase [Chitinophagaceae bacterium]|nr:polysaccharide biosynthesis tyrosine autokinase [Chitinophagaceae bacterium]